jgi:GT2 family glycosyltransferase
VRDVLLVTPTPGTVASSYMQSVLALQAHDRENGRRVSGVALMHCGAGQLPDVRNQAVRVALDSGAGWLWMVDSDMGFGPDTLDRLLACDVPVAGALCAGLRSAGPDGLFGSLGAPFHTLYGDRFQLLDPVPDTLMTVHATGAGCLLVRRDVLEAVASGWFEPLRTPSGHLGEDLSFCDRVNRAGFPVRVHTGVRTSHYQQFWI